jgi:hypothetical protein
MTALADNPATRRWLEICSDPAFADCPERFEVDAAGQLIMSPTPWLRRRRLRRKASREKSAYEKMIADDIIAALIGMQAQIRWHDIIYTDWLPGTIPGAQRRPFHFHIPGGGGGYGGKRLAKNPVDEALGRAHENHVHVDWVDLSLRIPGDVIFVYDWPQDALSTGFAPDLMGRLMLTSRR